LQLQRSAEIMSMPFHSKNKIFSTLLKHSKYSKAFERFQVALRDNDQDVLESIGPHVRDGIRAYIEHHNIQVIESVQPPDEFANRNAKGNALSFMKIYKEDPLAFESVKHVFLTGFTVPASAYERLAQDGIAVSTTWGSTETMALATHPERFTGNINDLIETPFPTVGTLAVYKERNLESPELVPVKDGDDGLLLVTSLIGAGSVYINYMIGDVATKTKEGYLEIRRLSSADISGSCAADALSI